MKRGERIARVRNSPQSVDVSGGGCEELKNKRKFCLLKSILFALYTLFSTVLFAQNSRIQVLEPEGNSPVHLAHVLFQCQSGTDKGKEQWVITDEKGWAENPYADTSLALISHIRYEEVELLLLPTEQKVVLLKVNPVGLNETVVTGQFSAVRKKESVYKVSSIGQKEIDSKGATNMREAINGELNFRTNNGHVNETSINLNGLSGNHVKIMIDGVPVVGRLRGNIDLSQLNLNNVERVEVIEGPTSVVYGTNALGGVVNIITKKNIEPKKSICFNSYVESVGQYNIGVDLSFRSKKNTYKLHAGRNFFAGYSSDEEARLLDWKPREQYFANFMLSRRIKHFRLVYGLDGFSEKMTSRGAPIAPYYTKAFDTYYKTARLTNRVLLRGRISGNKHLDITASHSYFERTRNIYFKELTTLSETLTPNTNDQDTTVFGNLLFRAVLSSKNDSSKFNYVLGSEINSDRIVAGRIAERNQNISNYALFVQARYKPFEFLTLQPALRYAYNTRYDAPLIPSINALLRLNDETDIRLSYAKGFRAPDLKELFLQFQFNSSINLWGNTNLNPENSDHYNVFLDYTNQWGPHRLSFNPKLYYTKVNNLIGLVQTTDVDWVYSNINFFISRGGAISFQYGYKNVDLRAALNVYETYNSVFDDGTVENTFFNSSDITSGIKYTLDSSGLSLSLNYKYTGEIRSFYIDDNQEIQESLIGDFHTLDCTATKGFRGGKYRLTMGIKNIFDVSSVRMVGEVFGVSNSNNANNLNVLFGRTGFVSLRMCI